MGTASRAEIPPAPRELTKKEQDDLAAARAALDLMIERKHVRIEGPYILTIPQEPHQVYRHRNPLSALQWTFSTPFTSDEPEERQYQTYTYYDPVHSMYRQRNNDYSIVKEPVKTTTSTPSSGPKKVMSLSAYKQAKASAPGTPAPEHAKTATQPPELVKNRDGEAKVVSQEAAPRSAEPDKKRKREERIEEDGYESGEISSPVSKRSRHDDTQASSGEINPFTQDMSLPMLSPLLDLSSSKPLPDRISPSLPPNIELGLSRKAKAKAAKAAAQLASTDTEVKLHAKLNGNSTSTSLPAKTDPSLIVKLKVGKESLIKAPRAGEQRKQDDDHNTVKKLARSNKQASPPSRPSTRSPELTKALPGTPKPQSTAMSRLQSTDSTTPADIDTPRTNGHIDRTPSKTKTEEQRLWEAEAARLDPIARALKHASQDHNKSKPPQSELAAVKALECFISYLLVSHSANRSNAAADPRLAPSYSRWAGLSGLFSYVRGRCADTPELAGIAALLGFAFSSHVLEIVENAPQNHEKDVLEFARLARRSAREMDADLNLAVIMASFPASWKARCKTPIKDDTSTPKKLLKGEYQLPVGLHTTPLQAARAAHALLGEWLAKSKLGYEMRIR